MRLPEHGVASAAREALGLIRAMRDHLTAPSADMDRVEDNLSTVVEYLSIQRSTAPWSVALSFGLTASEANLFDVLFKAGERGVSKQSLFDALYGNDPDGGPDGKIVDVFICKLRRKLRDADLPWFIETLWGRGYRLVDDADGSRQKAFFARPGRLRCAEASAHGRAARWKTTAQGG